VPGALNLNRDLSDTLQDIFSILSHPSLSNIARSGLSTVLSLSRLYYVYDINFGSLLVV
jgi:hypothetical protein